MVIDELKQQQENIEYPTVDDYLSNHKTHNANNQVIAALNHIDGYC